MRTTFTATVFGLAAGLALLALAGRSAAADEQKWGTIKGQVVLAGQVPAPKQVDVNKDQEHCLSRGPIFSEEWVVNPKNKGVQWAYVWLQRVPDEANPGAKLEDPPINPALKDVPDKPVVLDQPCCKFEPHALALRQGQTLFGKNSAPVAHNINWTGGKDNPGNNVIVPPGGQIEIKDLKASRFPVSISCNIHPWMKGWARVFTHPYFALTDADGHFEIKGAPAGTYNLVIWHEGAGYRDMKTIEMDGKKIRLYGTKIEIKPDAVTDLGQFDLKQPE
jgi:hypothetical protein